MKITKKELLSLIPGQKVYLEWEEEGGEEVIIIAREEDSKVFYYDNCGPLVDALRELTISEIGEDGSITRNGGNGYFWIEDDFRVYKGRVHEVIDCTPTWESVIDIYINSIENGSSILREAARHEIRRIAKIADEYNKLIKAGKI